MIKKKQQNMLVVGLVAFSLVALVNHAQAAIKDFDNDGGDYLFSNPTNWDTDALPVTADRVDVRLGTTVANPALVDSSWGAVSLGNCYFLDTDGAHITIQSNATFKFTTLYLGDGVAKSGFLTVENGGTLSRPGNTGSLYIGRSSGEGRLTAQAGATIELPSLTVGDYGVIEFEADSAGLASALLFGDTSWLMDGLLKVDLTDLVAEDTFILMSHDDDDTAGESMTGTLATWLAGNGGSQSGAGDGAFGSVFEVAGSDGKDWTLDYSEASGAGVLSLTVVDTSDPVILSSSVSNGMFYVSATNLSPIGTNYLQGSSDLVSGSWSNISHAVGVSSTNWLVTPLSSNEFFRTVK